MSGKWKTWIEEKGLAKWFQRDNLLILVLAGILLFVITIPVEPKESPKLQNEVKEDNKNEEGGFQQGIAYSAETEVSEESYAKELERNLEEILINMEGVGKVQVMVTLSASAEYVVEKDLLYNRSQTNETDSQGGTRVITQVDEQKTTIYDSVGNEQTPYVVKTLFPTIEGVVVVAEGAGYGEINRDITDVVQALFDVEAHKVKVVKMSKTN